MQIASSNSLGTRFTSKKPSPTKITSASAPRPRSISAHRRNPNNNCGLQIADCGLIRLQISDISDCRFRIDPIADFGFQIADWTLDRTSNGSICNPQFAIRNRSGRLEEIRKLVKAFEHQVAPGCFQLSPASKPTRNSASHGTRGVARVYINRAIPDHDGLMRSRTA